MNAKPVTGIVTMIVRRLIGITMAVIGLFLMTACSSQSVLGGSAIKQDASAAQQKAAEELGIPVEKTLPKSGIVLRFIPAGTFLMGSPKTEKERMEDETQHKVTLTNAFYIGKYEVTQGQWKTVMGSNPSCFTNSGDNAPVEMVSWHDCTNFMRKLAALEGMQEGLFRLPTEAEWEYACRAGTTTAFCYGDDLDTSMATFIGKNESRRKTVPTVPVGKFKPNALGLYDMHGNVLEWCENWYYYYKGHETNPTGPATGACRVLRGGSWDEGADDLRSALRANDDMDSKLNSYGFRLCMPTGP